LQDSIDGLKSENLYYETLLEKKNTIFVDLEKKTAILEEFVLETQSEREKLELENENLVEFARDEKLLRDVSQKKFNEADSSNRVLEDKYFELHQKFALAEKNLESGKMDLKLSREQISDLQDEIRFVESERQKLSKNSKTNMFLIGSLVFCFAVCTGTVASNYTQNGSIYGSNIMIKPDNLPK
jgi:chromosome segregation ATPase